MLEWKTTTIGDVLTLQRGFDITRAGQRSGRVPVVSSGGIGSYHDTAAVQGPGVVIGRKGTLGKVFYLPEDYWPHDTTLWVKDFKGSYPRFVYYFFKNLDVMGLNVGSANPTLNRNHIHPLPVRWPGADEQILIADLLGALDDKIAVNDQIALTGEELALATASDELWMKTVPLSEIASIARDQMAPENVHSDLVAHYSLPSFDAGQLPEVVPPSSIKSGKFVVDRPAVLLSKLNPATPRVWNVDPDPGILALASTEFMVLIPLEDISPAELWAVSRQPMFISDLANMATGTSNSHQRVRPNDLLTAHVIDPRSMPNKDRKSIICIAERCREARLESRALAALRDTLLPRLMSGEIRVRDAERVVEEVT